MLLRLLKEKTAVYGQTCSQQTVYTTPAISIAESISKKCFVSYGSHRNAPSPITQKEYSIYSFFFRGSDFN